MNKNNFSSPLSLRNVQITDTFWKKEMELVRTEVIPYQWAALNDQVEGIGYYDGQGSLFDMQLCCVITLMKSEDDLNPYTFTLPLNPIQKGES